MSGKPFQPIPSLLRTWRPSKGLAIGLVGVGLALSLTLFANPGGSTAYANHVAPLFIPHSAANLTCSDLGGAGQTWFEIKVDPPRNGTYGDGTVTITISNLVNAKSFDWSSNIGLDAAFVKAGASGNHLYRYDPPSEAIADTGLTSPGEGATNQISHISFCYDKESPNPTPTATLSSTPTATIIVGGVSSPPVPETPRAVVVNVPVPAPPVQPRPVAVPVALPALGDSPVAEKDAWLPALLLASGAAILAGAVISAVELRGKRRRVQS